MPSLIYTHQNGLVTLTLQRPDLDEGMITALLHHLSVLENHRSAHLLLLRGTGQFCRGLSTDTVAQWRAIGNLAPVTAALAPLAALLRLLRQFSVPTIALLEGEVGGCGTALAACCDLRLATPESYYCWAEPATKAALPLTLAVLQQQLGPTVGLLRSDKLNATEAQAAGLVQVIAPDMPTALARWEDTLREGKAAKTELLSLRAEIFKESIWVERSARMLLETQ